jgi:VWFA-related protein
MHQICPPGHPIIRILRGSWLLKPGEELRRTGQLFGFILLLTSLLCAPVWGQSSSGTASPQQPANGQAQTDQSVPDAPSAVQPAKPQPENPPSPTPETPPPQQNLPPSQAPPQSNEPAGAAPTDTEQGATTGSPPPINIRTVPQGGQTKEEGPDENGIYRIPPVRVNQVMVPVTVKDDSGHMVNGLTYKDFTILENGKKQKLNFFTSSPFALSAAVVIDLGMKDVDLQKVKHTLPSLEGAFSQFDELSIYAYSNTVGQLADWQAVGQRLSAAFDQLASVSGENNGPPVTSGPFGPNGPYINGRPADPSAPIVVTPVQRAHVLNDAILRAALDLAKRPKERRKVIFVISDGHEYRSEASYRDVLRVLLSNNIIVYAIDAGGSALPVFNTLSKIHLPRAGYSDILPKYVNATGGGDVFNVLTRTAIEDAYTAAMNQARNQYTLGYTMPSTPPGGYRNIEVLVNRPSCRSSIRPCVNIFAKDGYYPVPQGR